MIPYQPNSGFRKSSLSGGGNSPNCVEVADLPDRTRIVRDSKNPDGPALAFTEAEWGAFIGGVKGGEFD